MLERRIVAPLVLFALLSALPSSSAPTKDPAPTGKQAAKPAAKELRGRVAGEDGKPVKRAVVRILEEQPEREAGSVRGRAPSAARALKTSTGEDGTFLFREVPGQALTLRVEAKGFAPFTERQVPAGASVRVTLKKGFSASGIVRDLSTRKAIAGATVLACDPDAQRFGEEACRSTTTGDDGAFTVLDLPRGSVAVEARAPGHAASRLDAVTVPQAPAGQGKSVTALELFLKPGGRLAGRVVGADDKPTEGASLRLRPVEASVRELLREGGARPVTTDASGKFAFEGLATGRYRLVVEKKGSAPVEVGPYEVQPGTDRSTIEVRLESGATLLLRLVDAEGKPVHGLEVEIVDARGARAFGGEEVADEQIREGDEGRYTVTHLRAGTFTIRLLPENWADIEKESVKLRTGEATDLGTLTVREGRSIAGRVTDSAGAPVPAASVTAFWNEDSRFKTREARTRADGKYRLAGLKEAPLDMVVVRAQGFAHAEREGVTTGDRAVDFVLERTGSIVGRVQGAAGRIPAAFRVTAHPEAHEAGGGRMRGMLARFAARGPGREEKVFTDAGGAFRLDDVDPGTYTVEAVADHYAPARKSGIQVLGDGVADAGTLDFEEGIVLHGRALDARDESPVAGAIVRVEVPRTLPFRTDPRAGAAGNARSGMDGAFVVDGLRAGAYMVTVEHPDFSPSRTRVELDAQQDPAELVARMSRGGTLAGTVRNAQREPMPDARIVVTQGMGGEDARVLATGADGRYQAERLTPGNYQVMRQPVEGQGFAAGFGMKPAVVREGETTTVDFDEASKINLGGRVLRGTTPMPDTMLLFRLGDAGAPGEIKTAQSDTEGAYRIGLDQPGTYQVSVQTGGASNRGQSSIRVVVADQPEMQQDIVLPESAISGRVTDPEGQPVVSALVTAVRDGAAATDPTRQVVGQADAEGSFRLDGTQPGTYKVTVRAAGFRTSEKHPIQVDDSTPQATVDFELERGRLVRGRLVDPQGQGIASAMIFIAPSGSAGSQLFSPSQTDVNGGFQLTVPADGAVDITGVSSAWAPARIAGVTPPADEAEALPPLQATSGGRIRIQIAGPHGPVSGAQVLLRAVPPFPGSEFALAGPRRPQASGADGVVLVGMLAPEVTYEISLVSRRDVTAVAVSVEEGTEKTVSITVP